MDNKISFTPFLNGSFGQPKNEVLGSGAQLNVIVIGPDKDLVQSSYYRYFQCFK